MEKKKVTNRPAKDLKISPITRKEMHEITRERVHLIAEEFTSGFHFLENYQKSVTFFGGTHFSEDNAYYAKARELAGRIVRELQYSVLTGGGPGIMEAANRGAMEAGGQSLGLTIELPHEQRKNPYLTNSIGFHYFFCRKVCLAFSAEAYIFFPGGFGTLDEFFELVTLVQTAKIEKTPIILVGSDFWDTLFDLMKDEMLSRGTIEPVDLTDFQIIDDIDKIVEIVRRAPIRLGLEYTHKNLAESGILIEPNALNTIN